MSKDEVNPDLKVKYTKNDIKIPKNCKALIIGNNFALLLLKTN